MPKIPNIHPGEVLAEEFLKPLGLSQNRLAEEIGVPPNRINAIVRARRALTADTALRLSRFFNTTPEFWLRLQMRYDLEAAREPIVRELTRIRPMPRSESAAEETQEFKRLPGLDEC